MIGTDHASHQFVSVGSNPVRVNTPCPVISSLVSVWMVELSERMLKVQFDTPLVPSATQVGPQPRFGSPKTNWFASIVVPVNPIVKNGCFKRCEIAACEGRRKLLSARELDGLTVACARHDGRWPHAQRALDKVCRSC